MYWQGPCRASILIVSWYGTNRAEFQQAVRALGIPAEFHAALPDRDYPGHTARFFAEQVGATRI